MNTPRRSVGLRGATPIIDLLFIMLFGLLALSESRSSTEAETVRIQLPRVEPQPGNATGDQRRISLRIDRDSRVWLEHNTEPVSSPKQLDSAMAPVLGDDLPEQVVVEIRGDTDARHGVAVALLQHLRRRGFAAVHLLALGGTDADWGTEPR